MDTQSKKAGRPATLSDKQRTVNALRGIRGVEGYTEPSRYIKLKLADAGLITFVHVKKGGQGRPEHMAKLTPRGNAMVNFSK